MPRVTLSWARAGVSAGPPPAAATAIAVSNAIARAAGAKHRVLIGVPWKDIPISARLGVNLVTRLETVNEAGDHAWVMLGPFANNLRNTATAGQDDGRDGPKNDA